MSPVSTEVLRRVYDDNEGTFIEVGPGEDGLGVTIRTVDEKSRKWFGPLNITMDEVFCAALGNALIAASKESK